MKSASALHKEYGDVVVPQVDDDLLELVGILDAAYALEKAPIQLTLAVSSAVGTPAPEADSGVRRRRVPWLHAFVPHRSVAAAVGLAAALTLSVVGYATAPLLERAFELNTGTRSIIEGNLGTPLNLSSSVDGFRLTLDRAYADAGKIVVGFDIAAPPARHINSVVLFGTYSYDGGLHMNSAPVLTDDHGDRFSGGLAAIAPGVENGQGAGLLEYDPAGLADDGAPLHMHLHATAILVIEQLAGNTLPAGHPPCEERTGTICAYTVRSAFDFKFTVPVTPSRVAQVNQSSTVGGTTVALERVVTAPTGTTVTLRGSGPFASVQLVVGGQTYRLRRPDGAANPERWSSDSTWEYASGKSLIDTTGQWTLIVQSDAAPPVQVAPHATVLSGGPWVFHFTPPPGGR